MHASVRHADVRLYSKEPSEGGTNKRPEIGGPSPVKVNLKLADILRPLKSLLLLPLKVF